MSQHNEEALTQSLKNIGSGQYSEDDLWQLAQARLHNRASITVEGDVARSVVVAGDNNTVTYNITDPKAAKAVRQINVKVQQLLKTLETSTHDIYQQTRFIRTDLRRVLLLLLGVVALLLPIGLGVYLIYGIVRPPTEPRVMDAVFNVAVARFGELETLEIGTPTETDDTNLISAEVAEKLSSGINAITSSDTSMPSIDVQYEVMPLISGATPEERDTNAAVLAERINADILVYGYINRNGNNPHFIPRFYISPRLVSAEGVTGNDVFGSLINLHTPLTEKNQNKVEFDTRLTPRMEALAYFVVGLAYIKADLPTQSLMWFEKADGVANGWAGDSSANQGKEILYLWTGTALHEYAMTLSVDERFSETGRCWWDTSLMLLDCATDAYNKALGPKETFARAYIGLGNLIADEFDVDCGWYEDASESYNKALELVPEGDKDPAYVRLKTYYNLGLVYANAYRKSSDPACEYSPETKQDLYDTAIKNLTQALALYTADEKKELLVHELGARIHYQLGALYMDNAQYALADAAFTACIEVATPQSNTSEEKWQGLRWSAYRLRGHTYQLHADQVSDKAAWQTKALNDFNLMIDTARSGGLGSDSNDQMAEVYYFAGEIYEDQGQASEAIASYQQALDLSDEQDLADIHALSQAGLERLQRGTAEPGTTEPEV